MSLKVKGRGRNERELACPVGIWVVCIGKEVIGFYSPRSVHLVKGVKVTRRSRVEHLHLIRL